MAGGNTSERMTVTSTGNGRKETCVTGGIAAPASGGSRAGTTPQEVVGSEFIRVGREVRNSLTQCLESMARASASFFTPAHAIDLMALEAQLIELARLARETMGEKPRVIGDLTGEPTGPDPVLPTARATLTARETEIMRLIDMGLSNRQIAARLVISPKTVKNHICNIYQRLRIHDRTQALNRWREMMQSLCGLRVQACLPGERDRLQS